MTVTVNANGLSIAHLASNGISTATVPDVCKTPSAGGAPIPYPNISMSSTLSKGTTTVMADGGNMIAINGSQYSTSSGDEPGAAGGVTSSTFKMESTWITYSFNVKMDGSPVCRLTDKKFQNHKNTVDCAGNIQPPVVGLGTQGSSPAAVVAPPAPATLPAASAASPAAPAVSPVAPTGAATAPSSPAELKFTDIDEFNRAANNALPNTRYTYGNYTWTTNEAGKLGRIDGFATLESHGRHVTPGEPNTVVIGNEGGLEDVGFHYVGDQFGGPINRLNVAPGSGRSITLQNGEVLKNLNLSRYKTDFENPVANIYRETKQPVPIRIEPIYNEGNLTSRADAFTASYQSPDGEWTHVPFENRAGG